MASWVYKNVRLVWIIEMNSKEIMKKYICIVNWIRLFQIQQKLKVIGEIFILHKMRNFLKRHFFQNYWLSQSNQLTYNITDRNLATINITRREIGSFSPERFALQIHTPLEQSDRLYLQFFHILPEL